MFNNLVFTPTTRNAKTGPMLTVSVAVDALAASCSGCTLAPKKEGGNGQCYARNATPEFALMGMMKAEAAGRGAPRRGLLGLEYSLTVARAMGSRMCRITAIGDIVQATTVAEAVELQQRLKLGGFGIIGYTHFWRDNNAGVWRDVLMASCETAEDAMMANAMGWRAAVHVAHDRLVTHGRSEKDGDRTRVVCPAQVAPGKVTCVTCRLCSGTTGPNIAFLDHSKGLRLNDMRAKQAEKRRSHAESR